jgi:2-C-methyl-D-erythritol 4-phosphate cytidylyltransferase
MIKMGGRGVRFGASVPKQFYEINGEPLFAYVLRKYEQISCIDKFIVVTNEEWFELTETYAKKILKDKLLGIVNGGKSNVESVYNGVKFADGKLADEDLFLVHDVTDPIIQEKAIRDVIFAAEAFGSAAVITEQVHTLYRRDADGFITGTIDRNFANSGYSPEAFRYSIIKDCFGKATPEELERMTSAVSLVCSRGINVKTVVSHQIDLKITYREDMDALMRMIENGERLYSGQEELEIWNS